MSSFGYLRQLEVDFLKIDGAFVQDMVEDPIDRAMVDSINRIGQLMGLSTIAEFVADQRTIALLGEIGVDMIQGNGVSLPVPFVRPPSQSATPARPALEQGATG
jgi:EAL domain-containing protein (putative c-di-GMP-specific phosphodiesterase class I)